MKYDAPKLNILTDHVGMFERTVPAQHWRAITLLMLVLIVLTTGAWEIKMRSLGLRTADIDDGKSYWAVERRKIDSGASDQVAIIGDSRILFDTNLDLWQQLTGVRPIQLALIGTPALPFLTDLADDEHFKGLVVLGINDAVFFVDAPGVMGQALAYAHSESPSQRLGHQINLLLSRRLAFLDTEYSLFPQIDELDLPNRTGVDVSFVNVGREYATPWKLQESFADRQTTMWPRIETDPYLQQHAKHAWSTNIAFADAMTHGGAYPDAMIDRIVGTAKRDIEKIRSRGGEVVIVRPPSASAELESERIFVPRAKAWDRLLRETHSFGIHFEDYPDMQGLTLPEWSHLAGADQKKFTRAYVTVLCEKVAWLQAHGATCTPTEYPKLAQQTTRK